VALLHLIAAHRRVLVLHVDHGLRASAADDARFVEELAADHGAGCSVLRVDVAAADSVEAAARDARYGALEDAAQRLRLAWIATAHTLDDQAETVLMRALRGSGIGGVGGIRPVRGVFVRPLLDVRRSALRDWLIERELTWREDETNLDTRFERNWVRHELMPLIEQRRPGAASTLARLSDFARADDGALESLAEDVVERSEFDDAGALLEGLASLPSSIASRVVRRACWRLGEKPSSADVTQLMTVDGGRCGRLVARRLPGALAILRDPLPVPSPVAIAAGSDVASNDWGVRVRVGAQDGSPWTWRTAVPDDAQLVIRSRRDGDRVQTTGGTRKVSDVLIDAKVPRAVRDFVPILATHRTALAVVGLTRVQGSSGVVVDVEPLDPSWSRAALWR